MMKFLSLIVFNICILQNILGCSDYEDNLFNAVKVMGIIKYFSPFDEEHRNSISTEYLIKYIEEKPDSFITFSNVFFNEYLDSTLYVSNENIQPTWIKNNIEDIIFNNYISFNAVINEFQSSRELFSNESKDTINLTINKLTNIDPEIQSTADWTRKIIDTSNKYINIKYILDGISIIKAQNNFINLEFPKERYFTKEIANEIFLFPNIKYNELIQVDTVDLDNLLTLFIDRKINIDKIKNFKSRFEKRKLINLETSNILLFAESWNRIRHFYYKSVCNNSWDEIASIYLKNYYCLKERNFTINYLNNSLKIFNDLHNKLIETRKFNLISDLLKLEGRLFIRDKFLNIESYIEITGIKKNNKKIDIHQLINLKTSDIKNDYFSIVKDELFYIFVKNGNKKDTLIVEYDSYLREYVNSKYIVKELNGETLYLNFCDIYKLPDYNKINHRDFNNYIVDLRGHITSPMYLLKIIGNVDTLYSPLFRKFDILHPNFKGYIDDTLRWRVEPNISKDKEKYIYLLTNSATFSSSETTCALFKENFTNCFIIGHNTSGSNGTVDFFKLDDNVKLSYTTNEVIYNLKTDNKNGIKPDLRIPDNYMMQNIFKDPYLEYVLELIKNKVYNEISK